MGARMNALKKTAQRLAAGPGRPRTSAKAPDLAGSLRAQTRNGAPRVLYFHREAKRRLVRRLRACKADRIEFPVRLHFLRVFIEGAGPASPQTGEIWSSDRALCRSQSHDYQGLERIWLAAL